MMVIPRQWVPKRDRYSIGEARINMVVRDSREAGKRPSMAIGLFERMTTAQRQRAGRMSANAKLAKDFAQRVK